MLTVDALRRIRDAERTALGRVGSNLVAWRSVVPCFWGRLEYPPQPLGELPEGTPTDETIQQCLAHIVNAMDSGAIWEYKERFSGDFESSFVGAAATCAAIRSSLEVAASADFDRLLHELVDELGDASIEVTIGGDAWMTFRELYLSLQGDVWFVSISVVSIWIFLVAVLRMPILASYALIVILLCFPVTIAVYLGVLDQSKLPILSVVSLYLVLGIGADAVFIFTNTCALLIASDSLRLCRVAPLHQHGHAPPPHSRVLSDQHRPKLSHRPSSLAQADKPPPPTGLPPATRSTRPRASATRTQAARHRSSASRRDGRCSCASSAAACPRAGTRRAAARRTARSTYLPTRSATPSRCRASRCSRRPSPSAPPSTRPSRPSGSTQTLPDAQHSTALGSHLSSDSRLSVGIYSHRLAGCRALPSFRSLLSHSALPRSHS